MEKIASNKLRGRPTTRNKPHVLESAMHAYWQADGAAMSVNSICLLAGVSKPSLYRDFGSEDGLTAAVLKHYGEMVLVSIATLLSSPQAYGSKLDALINFACDDPQMEAGCLFVKMRATRSRFGPQTQALLDSMEVHYQGRYAQFFKDAAGRGEWRGGITTDLAASYLQEQIALAVSRRSLGKSPKLVRDMLELAITVLR